MTNGVEKVTETFESTTVTCVWLRLIQLSEEFPMIVKESPTGISLLPLQELREDPLS
jgi:hypothetical protein